MVAVLNIDRFPRFVAIQPTLILNKPKMLYIGWCKQYFYCISINPHLRSFHSCNAAFSRYISRYLRSISTYVFRGDRRILTLSADQREPNEASCIGNGSGNDVLCFRWFRIQSVRLPCCQTQTVPRLQGARLALHQGPACHVHFWTGQWTFSWRNRTPS